MLMKFIFSITAFMLLASCSGSNDPASQDDADPMTFEREINTSCIAPDPSLSDNGVISILAQRDGRIFSFSNQQTANTLNSVLNISGQVNTDGEFGLTGFAIHPSYPADNRLFVLYSDKNSSNRSTLSSFSIDTNTLTAQNEEVLITLEQPASNHNGGDIAFGDDGYLYIGFGDGGFDRNTSQQLTNLYGSLLRIDVSDFPYSIPRDNPFNEEQALCVDGISADGAICPEIYAYGFRNPWRWGKDSVTGDIWVGDVGERTFEEINKITAGGNYGWPVMEGNICSNNEPCDTTGLILPTSQYGRDEGVSVVGGYVYRGTRIPSLVGHVIFGDIYSGNVFSIPSNSPSVSEAEIIATQNLLIIAFAQDNNGEIYALNFASDEPGNAIYQLDSSGATRFIMPEKLSETGCFNPESKTVPVGVTGYNVKSTLWSDGASKQRFFSLENDTSVQVDSRGDFIFPEGAILQKHFLSDERYLETRLMVNFSDGWRGYSYEWNATQDEAILIEAGKSIDAGTFIHTIPSRSQCFQCHTAAANFSLGLETAQQSYHDDELNINFIDYLNQTYLDSIIDVNNVRAMASLNDTSATIETRARSYLHSNCASCHRPNASASLMDLRFSTSLQESNACQQQATLGDFGFPGAMRISPGNAEQSVLVLRMETLTNQRMPPLASNLVDADAMTVIKQWINELQSCD